MSYTTALEAAGAIIHEYEYFGSYQGDWWAYVTYNGETGWINGSYGSCSGCDAFEGEFDYYNTYEQYQLGQRTYSDEIITQEMIDHSRKRLADFGKTYLDDLYNNEEALKNASRNIEWDSDAEYMVKFIKETIEKYNDTPIP